MEMQNKLVVLLVEDELIVQKVHTMMLEGLGCRVELAKTGEEAVSMASKNTYDITFMDIGLPDFTGTEAATKIRSAGVKTPIVALTAYNLDEIKEDAKRAGINGMYQKPIDKSTFEKILGSCVCQKTSI